MKSALEELIFQNNLFLEGVSYSQKYYELNNETDKLYEKLKATLNNEQIELLNKLVDKHLLLEAEGCDCHLLYGFKTALKVMAECL